eukprot:6022498-Prymnesium_polylepis.1
MASAVVALAVALGAPGPAPLRLRLGALGARGSDETGAPTTGTRRAEVENQGADPIRMERHLLWSFTTGPSEPGGGGMPETRDAHLDACFKVRVHRRAIHDGLCANKMLWLG